jgi:hypothetical protein
MNRDTLQNRIEAIAQKRQLLEQLKGRSDLGNLTLDVEQALEELDELLSLFRQTFPDTKF